MKKFLLTMAIMASVASLSGCLSYPAEETNSVDNRPRITFDAFDGASSTKVFVDGIENGYAGDYRPGKAALRILPGTHIIMLVKRDGTVTKQRVFVSEGVTKTMSWN